MASRRMFSCRITESTRFLKMPATSQNLYFHLGINADDDGVVEAYPIMCKIGATEDDLRILVGKEFVVVLNDDLVSFITDWREHNNVRADRKVDSIYKDLLLKVVPNTHLLEAKETYYSRKSCQSFVRQEIDKTLTNDGIGKDRVGEESIGKDRCIWPEPEEPAPDQSGILLPLADKSFFDVPLSKIADWEAAYPAVDVRQELLKMIAWLNSNPQRRKTKRGIASFVNNWLSKEQDRGGRYRIGTQATEIQQTEPPRPDYLDILKDMPPCPDDPFR